MKMPVIWSGKSDFIMVVLFLGVVLGFVAKGFYSMSNRFEVPAFLDIKSEQVDHITNTMTQE